MLNEIRFAIYAIKKNIQSSAELRTSFVTNVVGMAINNSAFILIWVFFVQSVGIINGWTAADMIGLLGFGTLCYGIVFSVASGIRKLAEYVATGVFDRFMLSPKNLLVRVATSHFGVSTLGDIVFGLVALGIYIYLIQANFYQILLIMLLVIISTTVFLSIAIIVYSTSFLFTDASSVTTGLFELFMTPSLFHGGAFQGMTRLVFTFFIPSLLVGALPVEIVKEFSISNLMLVLILSVLWFLLSIKIFTLGVRRYESANFMTFGG